MNDRIAVVKSAGRADAFASAVRELGLIPVLVSPFRVEEVADAHADLCRALTRPTTWLVVTSPHAVPPLAAFVAAPLRVAAVGHGTAAALQSLEFEVEIVGEGGGEELGRRIVDAGLDPHRRIVHPCGEETRSEMGAVIAAAGATYVPVTVYRMVPDPVGERAAVGEFAAVIVGSPNLARRAVELFPSRPPAVAIGRTTGAALRDLGWPPAAVAASSTPSEAAKALAHALGRV